MSFAVKSASSRKTSITRRCDDDSSFESRIKAAIQEMQDNMRNAEEEFTPTRCNVRRVASVDRLLTRSAELSGEIEQLFREWTISTAGEPIERHRAKFVFEKLRTTYDQEADRLKTIRKQFVSVQKEKKMTADKEQAADDVIVEEEDLKGNAPDEECGLLASSRNACTSDEDIAYLSRVASERADSIQRISGQMADAHSMLRDLASLISSQGEQMETIEAQSEATVEEVKRANVELKKTAKSQRFQRDKMILIFVVVVIVVFFVVMSEVAQIRTLSIVKPPLKPIRPR